VPVQSPTVVHELKVACGATWAKHLGRRPQQGSRLGVSVRRLLNRVAVDPERDVVEKQAAVHLRHVDDALNSIGERVERTDQVVAVAAEIEREVVAGAGGNADEGKPVCPCSRRDDRE
jgi:hypothetical protein